MNKGILLCLCSLSLFLLGCEKMGKKLEVNPSEISIYSEGTAHLTTNVEDALFSSKDEFYASVDAAGLVKGKKVGKTEIAVSSKSGSASIPVTIMPQYSLYPDLDGLIGKGLSDITKVMGSDYTSSTTSSGDKMYTYKHPTTYAAAIGFTLTGGVCSNIIVAVSTSYTTKITKHLLERYAVAGMQNDYYFFLNHDKNVVIGMTVYSASLIAVMYIKNTSTKAVEFVDFSAIEDYRSLIR